MTLISCRLLPNLTPFSLTAAPRLSRFPPYLPSFILSLLHHTLRRPKGAKRRPGDRETRAEGGSIGEGRGRDSLPTARLSPYVIAS